jgi:hypothetical protein
LIGENARYNQSGANVRLDGVAASEDRKTIQDATWRVNDRIRELDLCDANEISPLRQQV